VVQKKLAEDFEEINFNSASDFDDDNEEEDEMYEGYIDENR
jgi:hypothetical protein